MLTTLSILNYLFSINNCFVKIWVRHLILLRASRKAMVKLTVGLIEDSEISKNGSKVLEEVNAIETTTIEWFQILFQRN